MFVSIPLSFADDDASHTATVKSRNIYESDIDATSSDIHITETSFDYTYKFKAFNELPVEVSLGVIHTDIDEDDPVDIPSHLESRRFGISTKFPAPLIEDDRFFMGIDIYPTFNSDDGAWESSTFRIPFRSYLIFKDSDDFILVGGISVRPEYEDEVLPVIGLIYRPNDRLSFNLASDNPNITYKINDSTKLLWEFDYTWDEYEVTRDTQTGVVLKYQEIATGFGVEHQFSDHFTGNAVVGSVFSRKLEYKDNVGKITPDAGLYASVHLTANF